MELNPYRPPSTDEPPPPPPSGAVPTFKLYSPGQAVLATFLGTPIAGAVLLAVNHSRWGEREKARNAALLGLLASCLLVGAGFAVDSPFIRLALSILTLVGVYRFANATQGERFGRHLEAGGAQASSWAAAGIGLVCAVAFTVVATLVILLRGALL